MKRRITYDKSKQYSKVNPTFGKEITKLYVPSVAVEFEFVTHKNTNGEESIAAGTDVQMLLRAQEIVNRDPAHVQEYFENMLANFAKASKNSDIESIKSKLSDIDLLKYIKPRHIQSIEELKAYGKVILEDMKDADANIKSIIEDSKSEILEKTNPSVENPTTTVE